MFKALKESNNDQMTDEEYEEVLDRIRDMNLPDVMV